ncbi:MAG: 2-hydroxyacid dehydrogenase [Hyphomonadaceae bacterium]
MSGKRIVLTTPRYSGINRLLDTYDLYYPPTEQDDRAAFLRDVAPRIEAVVTTSGEGLDSDILAAAGKLKLIALLGAGYEGFDLDALKARGIALTNCPAINHEDVADAAIGLLLSCARDVARGDRNVRAGRWREGLQIPRRLRGRTLGIVGFGAIGRAIAERGAAFGMDVRWTGPRAKPDAPFPYEPDLIALAAWSDFLAIACRADPGTEGMIDARVLAALGPEGVLISMARGSIVDEDALVAALESGAVGGAGLDVYAEEPTDPSRWAAFENVTLMPHMAGSTRESFREVAQIIIDNLRRHFAGEELIGRIV